jgi:hypothetical protein
MKKKYPHLFQRNLKDEIHSRWGGCNTHIIRNKKRNKEMGIRRPSRHAMGRAHLVGMSPRPFFTKTDLLPSWHATTIKKGLCVSWSLWIEFVGMTHDRGNAHGEGCLSWLTTFTARDGGCPSRARVAKDAGREYKRRPSASPLKHTNLSLFLGLKSEE